MACACCALRVLQLSIVYLVPGTRYLVFEKGLNNNHRDAGAGKGSLSLGKDLLHCLSPRGLGRRTELSGKAGLCLA